MRSHAALRASIDSLQWHTSDHAKFHDSFRDQDTAKEYACGSIEAFNASFRWQRLRASGRMMEGFSFLEDFPEVPRLN